MENASQIKHLAVGTTLYNGKYIIERVLGEGGFGITYLARHSVLNKQRYAIKEFFISGKCARDTHHHTLSLVDITQEDFERFRQRFVDEARTLNTLNHPGVVKVVDIFDDNNTSYIVMPFVEGETLRHRVEAKGRLPYDVAVNYIAQLAEALGYIHSMHILHRDVKPDNIMITPDDKVVLIDFGSARQFVNDEVQRQTSILTQGYAPPEQYVATSKKGNYTDIYALGAVLYFAVTGQKPIDSAGRSIERLPEPIELVPLLPPEANRTIMKAMQLRPEDRHQSAQEFMEDLLNKRGDTPQQRRKLPPFAVAAPIFSGLSMFMMLLIFVLIEELFEDEFGVICGIGMFFGIMAFIFSLVGLGRAKANPSAYKSKASLVVGLVLSIVSMFILAFMALMVILFGL